MIARWLSSGLPSFLLGNPLYLLIAAAVLFAAGSAAGWTANGWRLGTQIEAKNVEIARLTGENVILRGANARCAVDVTAVQGAVKGIVDASKGLADAAKKAMDKAGPEAKKFADRAAETLSRAAVAPADWCGTIMKEQGEYLELRRADRLGAKP